MKRDPIVLYGWRIKDKRTGRLGKLSWKMTEKDAVALAAQEGVEIQMVKDSGEQRSDVSGRFKPDKTR